MAINEYLSNEMIEIENLEKNNNKNKNEKFIKDNNFLVEEKLSIKEKER
jgi:hypothetical protein